MKRSSLLSLLATVAVSAAIGWSYTQAVGSAPTNQPPLKPTAMAGLGPRRQRPGSRALLPPGWSYIAVTTYHRLVIYRRPGSHRTIESLANPTSARLPLALLVKHTRRHWLETYLPTRPNGSVGWVPRRSVKLLTTAWSLTVRLRTHSLSVFRGRELIRTFRIGVGRSVTPTPTGIYFITELLKQPDPGGIYGPYAYGLSAHSNVYTHFGVGGDGQIGIHGTDEPQLVGENVSHGCIRLRNRNIIWLTKRLPLGTPVTITHS